MSRKIRNISSQAEADRMATDSYVEALRIDDVRIPPGEVHKYAGHRSLNTHEDDQNPGKFVLLEPFDAKGREASIERVAADSSTDAALKTKLAGHTEYTEDEADILEPRQLIEGSDPDNRTITNYTRAEGREALKRVPTATPDDEKQAVLREKVKEVISERTR